MALSSFSLWEEPLQGRAWDGAFPSFLFLWSPELLGSTCTSLREGGRLCIDMGWPEQPIPKTSAGRQRGTPTAPGGKGKGPGRTQSSQIPLERPGWIHVGLASSHLHPGAHPCPKHGEDPRKTQSWKPLVTAQTHSRSCCRRLRRSRSCSLPLEGFLLLDCSVPHI